VPHTPRTDARERPDNAFSAEEIGETIFPYLSVAGGLKLAAQAFMRM
jgi:hypothetical protein